jgi:hypothetical protein
VLEVARWHNPAMTQVALTLAEAAPALDPPMTREQLEGIIEHLPKMRPVGVRRPPKGSAGGRPARTYDADEIIDLHSALLPWL